MSKKTEIVLVILALVLSFVLITTIISWPNPEPRFDAKTAYLATTVEGNTDLIWGSVYFDNHGENPTAVIYGPIGIRHLGKMDYNVVKTLPDGRGATASPSVAGATPLALPQAEASRHRRQR